MAARDWRVIRTFAGRGALGAGRWALEEVGQPYEVRLVSFRAMKDPFWCFILSARFRPTKKAISACSKRGRSCSISRRATRGAKVWKKNYETKLDNISASSNCGERRR